MDRLRNFFAAQAAYEPLDHDAATDERTQILDREAPRTRPARRRRFSWLEYAVFVVLGLAMLWAW